MSERFFAWYSPMMHRELARPVTSYVMIFRGRTIARTAPGYVQVLPDGKLATIMCRDVAHGCLWPDMRFVGEYRRGSWTPTPADRVSVRDLS